jgi:N-acetylated-alpha-linked acidic dipeptidase
VADYDAVTEKLAGIVGIVGSAVAFACSSRPAPSAGLARLGYSAAAFEKQRDLEQRFRAGVSADEIGAFHKMVTRRPHMAGTDGGRDVAEYIKRALADAGLDVELIEYQAYLSFPRSVAVDIVAPRAERLRITEPPSPIDRDTQNATLGPGFVAYAASGDVTSPVVYVNYGLPDDYAQLALRDVDVRGKLVIARYGRSHRAVKLHTAEQQGAAGIILYSDPADDGFVRGETWPKGYWRTKDQIQRGNGKYSWFWHGDPLTPGVAAVRDAARQDPASAPTLPRIPAAVLSWGEVRKIFERLDGKPVPPGFQGGLPLTYRTGGGTVRARLRVQMDNGLRTIRDVVARVPGARQPDREVILGTHHDAWTFGGVDPGTGTAALLELGRVLGALRRGGWQPQRTITLAFWDAEEFGLIGSTEYAEDRLRALRERAICYINTDLYMKGRLDAGGTPSLRDLLVEVTQDVPEGSGTMYDGWRNKELKSLGSGADFVPFQDYVGLPTLSIELTATGGYTYGAYHSNYDTRFFVEQVADPGFQGGAQLVRLLGATALRLGESQILPFRFSHYATRLKEFVDTASTWAAGEHRGVGAPGVNDDRRALALDLTPVRDAVARLAAQANLVERRIDDRLASGDVPATNASRLNDALARLEQRLVDDSRPWYRHVIYGWNIYSLYDGQPFPGLVDAIRLRDRDRATREVAGIAAAINRLHDGLRRAVDLVN